MFKRQVQICRTFDMSRADVNSSKSELSSAKFHSLRNFSSPPLKTFSASCTHIGFTTSVKSEVHGTQHHSPQKQMQISPKKKVNPPFLQQQKKNHQKKKAFFRKNGFFIKITTVCFASPPQRLQRGNVAVEGVFRGEGGRAN